MSPLHSYVLLYFMPHINVGRLPGNPKRMPSFCTAPSVLFGGCAGVSHAKLSQACEEYKSGCEILGLEDIWRL